MMKMAECHWIAAASRCGLGTERFGATIAPIDREALRRLKLGLTPKVAVYENGLWATGIT